MPLNLNDIQLSKSLALEKGGWIFGELLNRIGDPFTWVDGDQMSHVGDFSHLTTILQYLTMSGEIYDTPTEIKPDNHDAVLNNIRTELKSIISSLVPFPTQYNFEPYIESTATVKVQDFSAIHTWAKDLPEAPCHLDIGPGLGANALYSIYGLNSKYISLEAHPVSYEVQRQFFRALSGREFQFLDAVACEVVGGLNEGVLNELSEPNKYILKLAPSWHAEMIPSESVDLVSATWVLNEVTSAGICWLLHHAMRSLRVGGYFYIRDSEKLKPLRHQLNYDAALLALGFKKIARLNIKNRVDLHGIPRIYQKINSLDKSFIEIYDQFFDRFVVSSHGGEFNQGTRNTS
jgi:hypothetical protein